MSATKGGIARPKTARIWEPDDIPGAAIGEVLGEYELVDYLGRGGMADVYTAIRRAPAGKPREVVAVKRFLRKLAPVQHLMELFLHEAKLTTAFSHPNLVKGIDFGVTEGTPFLVMELIDGFGCDRIGPHRLPPGLAFFVVREVLRALSFVHEASDPSGRPLGVVHHDVAPDNILISRRGEVKLSDFGVAHSVLAPNVPGGRFRGKLGYMSPEQVASAGADLRSDLFSAGVVLTELLLARRLFERGTDLEVLARAYDCELGSALGDLEPGVREITGPLLARALARDPRARYQSARELEHAVTLAAEALGGMGDGDALASWLVARGLDERGSGVRRAVRAPTPATDVEGRISRAPREVVTAAADCGRTRSAAFDCGELEPLFVLDPADGAVLPLSLGELIERVVTGRARWDTRVSVGSDCFSRLDSRPELAELARVEAYRFADEADGSTPFERGKLPSLLFQIARSKATGLLRLRAGKRQKRVFFERGAPCFVASTDPTELIGQRLVKAGLTTAQETIRAVALAARKRQRLGNVLVEAGLISPPAMLRALVEQLEQRTLELGLWVTGEIAFERSARTDSKVPRLLGPAAELPCRIVRRCYSDTEVDSLVGPLWGSPLSVNPSEASEPLPLTEIERAVVEAAAQESNPAELEARLAQSRVATPAQCRRAVLIALSAGLLASPSWQSARLG